MKSSSCALPSSWCMRKETAAENLADTMPGPERLPEEHNDIQPPFLGKLLPVSFIVPSRKHRVRVGPELPKMHRQMHLRRQPSVLRMIHAL